jgi:bifunctional UDP-N-acetylglucosamine pyrophosphorylase/glucosamine-1-phosphate N-acetyltransferase
MKPKNANHSYGRLQIVGSQLEKIIEKSELQGDQKKIDLCNSGIMIIKTDLLSKNLKRVGNKNNKKEFYLTDIVEIMSNENFKVGYEECSFVETLGVNDKTDLSLVEEEFQVQARKKFLRKGVTLIDPKTVYFSYDTKIGKDVVIHPNVYFGPGVKVGNNVILKSFSHIENSIIFNNAIIGPFARTRDYTVIGEDARVGNFVEIKKSKIDKKVKASHLSYIGDATIDENTNIGAGTITCNFDGISKHKTFIGENCFIGSNTSLIAPIKIKKNSVIGAGTVIKKDVPTGTTVYRKSELIKKNNKKKR